ncbi:Trm112 family protein [Aquicoccus sp. SCR17]|nr:Trm112 family protein [Carideicomes alvinocaridis]
MTTELPSQGPDGAQFDRRMLEALVCPQTGTALRYDAERQELVSETARLAFPIRNGIPVMLIDEARVLGD